MKELVVLVDKNDVETGVMEKLEAHQTGTLHRAISVFVFNASGELLMQKRAADKYHSAGLWTNTCCSHPAPGESVADAANRRLQQEMGLKVDLQYAFPFHYLARFDNGLTEHELDHVFYGFSDEEPQINATEVEDWRYYSSEFLKKDLAENPSHYTEWFKLCWERLFQQLKS